MPFVIKSKILFRNNLSKIHIKPENTAKRNYREIN